MNELARSNRSGNPLTTTRRAFLSGAAVASTALRSPDVRARQATPATSSVDGRIVLEGVDPASGENAIFTMNTDGTDSVQLTTGEQGYCKHPDWSPDGQRIAYVNDLTLSLWTMNADGSDPREIFTCSTKCGFVDYPAWSPDGLEIAFTAFEGDISNVPSGSAILILNLESGQTRELIRVDFPTLVDIARWSPDGTRLALTIDSFDADVLEIGSSIASIPAAGGELTILTTEPTFAYYADWNRQTSQIVFGQESVTFSADPVALGDVSNLYVMESDGSDVKRITDLPTGSYMIQPTWTPDGTRIIATFDSPATGRRIVWVDPVSGETEPLPGGSGRSYARQQP